VCRVAPTATGAGDGHIFTGSEAIEDDTAFASDAASRLVDGPPKPSPRIEPSATTNDALHEHSTALDARSADVKAPSISSINAAQLLPHQRTLYGAIMTPLSQPASRCPLSNPVKSTALPDRPATSSGLVALLLK
jgi:hypothetical protein